MGLQSARAWLSAMAGRETHLYTATARPHFPTTWILGSRCPLIIWCHRRNVCAPFSYLREYLRCSINDMPEAYGKQRTMPGGNVLLTIPAVGLHASLCRACVESVVIVVAVVGLHGSLCRACDVVLVFTGPSVGLARTGQ